MNKKDEIGFREKYNINWVRAISFWTFIMAVVFTIITEALVENLDVLLAFIILILVISIGIFL